MTTSIKRQCLVAVGCLATAGGLLPLAGIAQERAEGSSGAQLEVDNAVWGPLVATDSKAYPGSMCQASGSAQSMYYSSTTVANRTSETRSVVCPIVRDNLIEPWLRVVVHVRDRHSTQDITCIARAREADGTGGADQSMQTSGEGFEVLSVGDLSAPDFGPYVLVCQLPPMEEVNQPSYISSYRVTEPE